jgi:hypothetical protein
MEHTTIVKSKTTYKISKISIDHRDAGTGIGVLDEDCDLTLEISPSGEPVRLLLSNDDVANIIRVLADHAYPRLIMPTPGW